MSLSPGQRWGLGVNAYLYFFASAVLAPKSNVADEGIPTDSPTLKQKAEGVIRNLTAGTGQADERVIPTLGMCDSRGIEPSRLLNHPQNDSRWQTEGGLPWAKRSR